jgi:hypothetical protein
MALRRSPHVSWRTIADETVLIHLKKKWIFVLNTSGGFIWHNLDGHRETNEILGLIPNTAIENETRSVAEILGDFLRDLEQAGLVESVSPQAKSSAAAETKSESVSESPSGVFALPRIVWREEMRRFGFSCAFISGESPACTSSAFE